MSAVTGGISNTLPKSKVINHIVIIDNIKQPWNFKQSQSIKREINKYFPNIAIRLAYSLRAGGVAIHVNSKKDQELILDFNWPSEAFQDSGATLSCHKDRNEPKVMLKNVDPRIPEEELQEILFQFTCYRNRVVRFKYQDSGKPLPVVKVTFTAEEATELLKIRKLAIKGIEVRVEDYKYLHRRKIECFNCKGVHIARDCT